MLTDEQIGLIKEFGVPVDSFHSIAAWVVALDRESHDMPTPQELFQIISFAIFTVRHKYTESAASRIIQSPPLKYRYSDFATIVFIKGWGSSGDGWHYRFVHWSQGPLYVPCSTEHGFRPHALIEAMDRCWSILSEDWARWKLERPEIFGT